MNVDTTREALRDLTRKALHRLREGGAPRHEHRLHHRLLETGGAQVETVLEPDWSGALFIALSQHMLGSIEMAAFQAAFLADVEAREAFSNEVGQIQDNSLLELSVGSRVVSPFVHHYLVRYGVHFSGEHFEEAYRALRRYVDAEEVAMRFTAPVTGLAADFEAIELAEDIAITRLSHAEKQALTNQAAVRGGGGLPDPAVHAVLGSSHAIRARRRMPRGFPLMPSFGSEPVEDALATLRIVGVEPATVRMVFVELEDPTAFHPRALDPVLDPDDKPGIRELPGPPQALPLKMSQGCAPRTRAILLSKAVRALPSLSAAFPRARSAGSPRTVSSTIGSAWRRCSLPGPRSLTGSRYVWPILSGA